MAEDEDQVLLTSLGIKSANPEVIERDVLAQAGNVSEIGERKDKDTFDSGTEASSSSHAELYHKLRAMQYEIAAVASTVDESRDSGSNGEGSQGVSDDGSGKVIPYDKSLNDLNLQHALAADRLRSLKTTKAQLEKELLHLSNDREVHRSAVDKKGILEIVTVDTRSKRKLKEVQKSGKDSGKRQKRVSLDDDDDFDAALDAASAGFIETERDELVRKGILTPFHKLKGFERRFWKQGTSCTETEGGKDDHLASASVDRAVQSMSEAARARPTTKLLESDDLLKLDAPTHSFRRLRNSLKLSSEAPKRKKRRPLPDRKWSKRVSSEEKCLEEVSTRSVLVTSSDGNQETVEVADGKEYQPYVTLEGGLEIPVSIFDALFDYQKVGVQWLWELHCQRAGGIIGDEMGLGKTIQVLSFLGALHFSNMYKPSIVVCPVTLLRQWKREAQKWYPDFHVEILHDSAHDPSVRKKRANSDKLDYDTDSSSDSNYKSNVPSRNTKMGDSSKAYPNFRIWFTYHQLRAA